MKKLKQIMVLREVKKLFKQPPKRPENTVRPENSLTHELMKVVTIYLIKQGRYPIDSVLHVVSNLKREFMVLENKIIKQVEGFDISKVRGKYPVTVYSEVEVGKDRVDILAVTEEGGAVVEIDYKHKTSKEKVERLKKKGLEVRIVE